MSHFESMFIYWVLQMYHFYMDLTLRHLFIFIKRYFLLVRIPLVSTVSWPPSSIFFAAEDEGRTEQPSERRKSKEREKGRVPKTQEIPGSLVALGCLMTIFFLASFLLQRLQNTTRKFLGHFNSLPQVLDPNSLKLLMVDMALDCIIILSPILFVAVFMGILEISRK